MTEYHQKNKQTNKKKKKKTAGNTKHLISRFEGHTKIARYVIVIKSTSINESN